MFGTLQPEGTLDFMVNGGEAQPSPLCSAWKVLLLFFKSPHNNKNKCCYCFPQIFGHNRCSHHYAIVLFMSINRAAVTLGMPKYGSCFLAYCAGKWSVVPWNNFLRCYGSLGTEVANMEEMLEGGTNARRSGRQFMSYDRIQARK